MPKNSRRMTTAQFAKLHEVNKRTLHYYDSIGLFSPRAKGENGYRYYDAAQSMDFEYIRMLKELNMSIEEIDSYVKKPNAEDFVRIADEKLAEIEGQIRKLRYTEQVLRTKREQLFACCKDEEQWLGVEEVPRQVYLTLPMDDVEEGIEDFFRYVKEKWGIEQCRMGIGSYISLDKVFQGCFEEYDGLFSPALDQKGQKGALVRPAGRYLCGYNRGTWEKLPELYAKMLAEAERMGVRLTGFAFEAGMNDFAIADDEEYITKVFIKIED